MKTRHCLALLLSLSAFTLSPAAEPAAKPTHRDAPWHSLFDGQTLAGWVQRSGKATYAAVDGAIVGTARITPDDKFNSFLCTTQDYGDFILELEFLDDPRLNSGVQIRSHCFDRDTIALDQRGQPVKNAKGEPIKVEAGRVHGYQIEIDPSARAWTGGIYDEKRRLWLVDLKANDAGRQAFKPSAWNHFRIEAIGPKIRVWLNGVLTSELTDDVTPRGFIGLQVHHIGNKKELEGAQIKFRNLRLQNLVPVK